MNKIFTFLLLTSYFLSSAWAAQESPRMTPVVKIVREVSPAVVNISTERVVLLRSHPQWGERGADFDSIFRDFISGYQAVKLPSLGSGVIIDAEGLILTNAHVVQMGKTIYVTFANGTKVVGEIVAVNQKHDLAIIKVVPPFPLKVIEMARPDDLLIGEPVIALGNPFGLSSSVSTGVVSATHRDLYTPQGQLVFKDLIQTDTAINPGSSGGALLNMEGKLIGLNQIVAQQAQGIGFAIPVKTIQPLLEEFKASYKKQAKEIKIPVT